MSEPEITVHKAEAYIPIDVTTLNDTYVVRTTMAEMRANTQRVMEAWNALPEAEKDRIVAERAAKAQRERAERDAERDAERCPHCGCHPDEHGGDW